MNEVLSVLIGLARATYNGGKDETTDALVKEALQSYQDNDETLRRRLQREKNRISPGCASCQVHCGNTDNYDLSRFDNAPKAIQNVKLEILEALTHLEDMELIYRGLYSLAEDWQEEFFRNVLKDIQK